MEGDDDLTPDRRLILAARTILVLHRQFEHIARRAEITIPQYRFLLSLKRGASRAANLAADSAIGRPTASVLIAEMERRGLIVREPDAADGRGVVLRLTPDGMAKHAAFEADLARALAELMPSDESASMLDALSELAYRVDSHRPEAQPD